MLGVVEIHEQWDAITANLTGEEHDQLIEAMVNAKAFEPIEQLFFAKGWLG